MNSSTTPSAKNMGNSVYATGPTYLATMKDMEDLPEVIWKLCPTIEKHGAISIIPPADWVPPECPIRPESKILQMGQTLPQPPFANEDVLSKRDNVLQDRYGRLLSDIQFHIPSETTFDKYAKSPSKVLDVRKFNEPYKNLKRNPKDLSAISQMEVNFWDIVENGSAGKPVKLFYANDVDLKELNDDRSEENEEQSSKKVKWSTSNINSTGCLRHMYKIPGVNSSFFYMGNPFTYFGIHCEDENLSSIAYLHSGMPKIWYVYRPCHKDTFESYASQSLFAPNYVNDYAGGARHAFQKKTVLLDPKKAYRIYPYIPRRFVQQPGSFIVTAPGAYHYGFNCGLNIAETVNYADSSWMRQGRVSSKVKSVYRIEGRVALPWELIAWREVVHFMTIFDNSSAQACSSITSHSLKAAATVWDELAIFLRRADRAIRHRLGMAEGRVEEFSQLPIEGWNEDYPELICDDCGHPTFLFVEVCISCDDVVQARCINHLAVSPSRFCNVHGHRSVIIRRYNENYIYDKMKKLKDVIEKKRECGMIIPSKKQLLNSKPIHSQTERDEQTKRKRRIARYERRKSSRAKKREGSCDKGGKVNFNSS